MSLSRLWTFLAIALPVLATLIGAIATVDLTYHLRAGGEILDSGHIPSADTWTFTAIGLPWVDQQWGTQVLLTGAYRLGGWTGLVLFRAILMMVIAGCLYLIGRRRGLPARSASILTIVTFGVAAVALGLRAQAIGIAFFAVLLLLVDDRRAHPERLWLVPLLVIPWANIHGSFFFAPLVLGLAWLEDLHDRASRPHRTLLIAVVAAAASCLTPFGPSVWIYAAGVATNSQVTTQILEWQPTSIRTDAGVLFFGSVIAVVAVLGRSGRKVPWPTLAWLGVFFVIGVYAARGVAWWPLAVVGIVAEYLSRPGRPPAEAEPAAPRLFRRLNAVIVGLTVVVGVALLPAWRPLDPKLDAPQGVVAWAPPGITAALRSLARPGDRLLNPQEWGSWFEFELPNLPLAMDSRIELYPNDVWEAYDGVQAGRGDWQAQLTSWHVTIAVTTTRQPALAGRLASIGWRTVYSDDDGTIAVAPDR